MGRQVRFYMTLSDEMAFLRAIQDKFGEFVLLDTFPETELKEVETLPPQGTYGSVQFCLSRRSDLAEVIYNLVPSRGRFSLNTLDSYVIEFTRCYMLKQGWLRSGRLWFEPMGIDGKKSDDFIGWADKTLTWIRRNYARGPWHDYAGPDAKRLCEAGLLLLGAPQK